MPRQCISRGKCAVESCNRPVGRVSWCDPHYRQHMRGAPFRDPRGREVANQVSTDGAVARLRIMSKGVAHYVTLDPVDVDAVRHLKWCLNGSGYASNELAKVTMHRLLTAAPAGMQVDHINGDTLDNRRANLRVVTKDENAANRQHSWSRTGCIGIGVDSNNRSKPYVVVIRGKHRGQFATLAEARTARDRVRSEEGMPPAVNDCPREWAA